MNSTIFLPHSCKQRPDLKCDSFFGLRACTSAFHGKPLVACRHRGRTRGPLTWPGTRSRSVGGTRAGLLSAVAELLLRAGDK